MQRITSTHNPAVQAAKALQGKAAREAGGLFLCEGEHMVGEAARFAPDNVQEIFVDENQTQRYQSLLNGLTGQTVYAVPEHVLAALSQVKAPQGIAATVRMPQHAALSALGGHVILLENVQDPGNVGTILRTADAAGFDACILTDGCADPFAPKCLRATMGSVFRVPIAVEENAALAARTLAGLGYATIATVLSGQDFYARQPLPPKVCLIIGNEGAGITPETAQAATFHFRLPMRGGAESLNAAVAASIFMYEIINRD